MKTLIAYASKYGTTRACAENLARMFGSGAALIDLKQTPRPDLSGYDQIIIGSPMYMGKLQKTVKNLCKSNYGLLLQKRLAFFVCGLSDKSEVRTYLQSQVPGELLDHAAALAHFGGEIRLDKARFMDKFVLEKMQQDKKMEPTLEPALISDFYEKLGKD